MRIALEARGASIISVRPETIKLNDNKGYIKNTDFTESVKISKTQKIFTEKCYEKSDGKATKTWTSRYL